MKIESMKKATISIKELIFHATQDRRPPTKVRFRATGRKPGDPVAVGEPIAADLDPDGVLEISVAAGAIQKYGAPFPRGGE